MSVLLRKKLSRRQATNKDEDHQSTVNRRGSNLSPVSPTSQTTEQPPVDGSDLSITTPQPPAPTLRPFSPSNLHRYKARAPAGVTPTVAPARSRTTHQTIFTEDFDHASPDAYAAPELVLTTKTDPATELIMVDGQTFDIVTASPTSRESAGDLPRRLSKGAVSARTTRSKARREERTDSLNWDSTPNEDRRPSRATNGEKEEVLRPAGLNIDKSKQLPRTPSPRASKDAADATDGANGAASSKSASFTLPIRPLVNFCKNTVTSFPAITTTSDAANQSSLDTEDHDTAPPSPANNPDLLQPRAKIPAFHGAGADSTDDITQDRESYNFDPPPTISITPPIYDPTSANTQQWVDFRGTTSRPDQAWGWCKRWACCRCDARTIVEQRECARLACGHGRCGGRCKVVRGRDV
ncbi:hypothetical protein LTR62_002845 [Meristemomyces frigidus]|uniref:Uncharacterized protein n=1 Tax=Meristemomyces frigidus TaxID=1508187 RepID=A0AAN7TQH8_9PEZI|nr:hypothetical protein LTR62_002845 [Meristemomyces frigidus]